MAIELTKEQQKQYVEDHEKAELLKKSLIIVDKLSKLDISDPMTDEDYENVDDLIEKAKKLTKNRLWKLK